MSLGFNSGLVAMFLVGTTILRPASPLPARLTGTHPLSRSDFYGFTSRSNGASGGAGTYYLDHDPSAVVAGVSFARAIDLHPYGGGFPAGISFNTARFPGYRALSFAVGIEDGNGVNTTAQVRVTVNGRQVWQTQVRQGQIAVPKTLAFGKGEEVISIVATRPQGGFVDVLVGAPAVLPGRLAHVVPPVACHAQPPAA